MYPHDSQIVVLKNKVRRVKGLIQALFLGFFKTVGSFFFVRQLLMILQDPFFFLFYFGILYRFFLLMDLVFLGVIDVAVISSSFFF